MKSQIEARPDAPDADRRGKPVAKSSSFDLTRGESPAKRRRIDTNDVAEFAQDQQPEVGPGTMEDNLAPAFEMDWGNGMNL